MTKENMAKKNNPRHCRGLSLRAVASLSESGFRGSRTAGSHQHFQREFRTTLDDGLLYCLLAGDPAADGSLGFRVASRVGNQDALADPTCFHFEAVVRHGGGWGGAVGNGFDAARIFEAA